jgi:Ribosomal protein L7/L12 C-terminal domain
MRQEYAEVAALICTNQKIQAIKVVRGLTNIGLKESKDLVDSVSTNAIVTQGAQAVAYALAQKLEPILTDTMPLPSVTVNAYPYEPLKQLSKNPDTQIICTADSLGEGYVGSSLQYNY